MELPPGEARLGDAVPASHPSTRRLRRPAPAAALLAGVAVAALAACAPRARPDWSRPAELDAERAPPTSPAPARTPARGAASALPVSTAPVVVRLAAWQGAERIELRSPSGVQVVVDRVGDDVRASGVTGERPTTASRLLRLPPATLERPWTVGDRRYVGVLEFRPRAGGGLDVRNVAPLEEYVACVVAAELPVWSAPPAELEAQAVAARTYALRAALDRTGDPFVWDDVRDQVYAGIPDLDASEAQRAVAARVRAAVAATRGRVLVQDGRLLDARYSAACGGRTARLLDVFPKAAPFVYPAASCGPCVWIAAEERATPRPGTWRGRVAWRLELEPERLDALARALAVGDHVRALRPTRLDAGGRWLDVEVRGDRAARTVPFQRIREVLGTVEVPSARVVATSPPPGAPIEAGLALAGLGRGHGVGLCQTGARELATRGYPAERILLNYYTRAELARLPDAERVP